MAWRPKKTECAQPQHKKHRAAGAAAAAEDVTIGGVPEEDNKKNDPSSASSGQSPGGGKPSRRGGRRGRQQAKAKGKEYKIAVKDKGLRTLIQLLAKLSLQNAMRNRMMWGSVLDAIVGDRDLAIYEAVSGEGEAYAEEVEAIHKTLAAAKKGSPDHDASLDRLRTRPAPCKGNFMAMVESLATLDIGATNKKRLTEWLQSNVDAPPDVCCCKIQSIRDDSKSMIIVGMRHVSCRDAIISSLVQVGAVVKSDAPPPSNLEDEVAAWLAALGS